MCKKCKIISLGKINKYIILAFLNSIFFMIQMLLKMFSTLLPNHPIIFNIIYSFGLCLSFSFLLINKICYARKNTKISFLSNESNVFNYGKKKVITKKEKFLWILFVSIINFISNIFYNFNFNPRLNIDAYYWAVSIIFLSLFSYRILKYKIYKHHYLGIIVIFINATICVIILFFGNKIIKIQGIKFLFSIFIGIVSTTLYNLEYVIDKYLIFSKFIKSFEIIFLEGVIELVISIIALIITTNAGFFDNFYDFTKKLNKTMVIFIIILILINFIFYSFLIIIIDIFSPFFIFLVYMTSITLFYIFSFISTNLNVYLSIVVSILYLINFFMILVFTEIIELNCFGLSYMTKKNIELRAKLESFSEREENTNEDSTKVGLQGYIVELNDVNKDESLFMDDENSKED